MGIKVKKEKKPRKTKDIENKYPKWPWVDYKFQDAKFFKEVRKLLTRGLDKYVTIINVAKIFSNVHKFKIKNPLLIEEQKKKLENLYWKIYGIGHITNNKLYLWIVKGSPKVGPKVKQLEKIYSWGTLPNSQPFGGRRMCWSSKMELG